MYRITTLHADGRITKSDQPRRPTLTQLQKGVGGLIQAVPDFDRYGGKACEVYCNEEGLAAGLPLNLGATAAWRVFLTEEYGKGSFDPSMAFLVGDVVIVTKLTDGHGEDEED